MPNHIQISIEANEEQQELLISQFIDLGATGFEQSDTHLTAYFEEEAFPSYDVNALLEGFVFQMQTLPRQNWNAAWESSFQPVVVDTFCAVRADFHEPVPGVQHEIIITPKMSFGTGHHATTYMMLEQMRSLPFRGKRVFDFGTGTGILAILAEKLGAASILAIDNDEWSIENGRENLQRNGCSRIQLQFASSVPEEQFDVILANINRNVILMHLPRLAKALVPGGSVLFSGLLKEDGPDIIAACKAEGLRLLNTGERNNWISLLFANNAAVNGN